MQAPYRSQNPVTQTPFSMQVMQSTMISRRPSHLGVQLDRLAILRRVFKIKQADGEEIFRQLIAESGQDVVNIRVDIASAAGLKKKTKFG